MARPCKGRQKKPFAAEQYIFKATNHLDIKTDGGIHHSNMTGVDKQALTRCEIFFYDLT